MLTGPGLKARSRYADAWARSRPRSRTNVVSVEIEQAWNESWICSGTRPTRSPPRGWCQVMTYVSSRWRQGSETARRCGRIMTAATDELERLAESAGEVLTRLRKLAVIDRRDGRSGDVGGEPGRDRPRLAARFARPLRHRLRGPGRPGGRRAATHRARRAETEVRQDPGRRSRIRRRCLTPGLRDGAADRQGREGR